MAQDLDDHEARLKLLENEVWDVGHIRHKYDVVVFAFYKRYRLSRIRCLLLWHLVDAEFVRYDGLIDVLRDSHRAPAAYPERSLSSLVRHIRLALEADDIKVNTIWGVGYYIAPEDKSKLMALCGIGRA